MIAGKISADVTRLSESRVSHQTAWVQAGLLVSVLLSACGGGGGGGGTSTPPPPPPPQTATISGTVAAGAAVTGTVSVYDSSTHSQPATANIVIGASGQYSVVVTGLTAPFLLQATGQAGGQGPTVTLYSVATAAGIVNITPITTLMAMNMAAGNVQTLMTGSTGGLPGLTAADLTAQNTGMDALLSSVLMAEGLSATYNFSTTTFAVDGTGYSQLLNAVTFNLTAPAAVTIANNAVPETPITIDTQKGSPNGPLDVISGPATLPVGGITIGGTISGLTAAGLQLQNNGADTLSVAANATSFTFATAIASGAAYAVSVKTQPSGQSCTVANGTGTAGSSSVSNVTVACTSNPATSYTVGGTISGLTASGLQLQDNGGDTISVAPNATSFTFTTAIASGATYAVTVKTQPSGQSCVVSNGTGTAASSNVTNITVACTTNSASTYTVSGTISGLTSAPLILELNGSEDLTLGAGATTFRFATALKPSSTYQVTVKTTPVGQVSCSVANGSGTIVNSDIVNVVVTCAPFYVFSGTVSNLKGATLILLLQNNGGYGSSVAPVLPGQTAFSFGVGVPNGTGYNVTVQQQPSGQSCTVANGSGTVSGSNVSSISVSCATVSQWSWISGDDSNLNPVYGTVGQGAAGNTPGSRRYAATWSDPQGQLWLFGGSLNASDPGAVGNDLWRFSPTTGLWTWMSGSKTANASGTYGTQGTATNSNVPGARTGSATWTDASGALWLFGGTGFDSQGTQDLLNDLWKYDTNAHQWTWVSGYNVVDDVGVYGTLGVAAPANVPSGRIVASTWLDKSGNLWLFGGNNCCMLVGNIYEFYDLNDVWRFNPTSGEWTWIAGSQSPNAAGVFGTRGVADSANTPQARHGAQAWTDAAGSFWLFGGQDTIYSAATSFSGTTYLFNDLWKYDTAINQWTWVGGPQTPNGLGSYGTQGVAAASNLPGARAAAANWTDLSGEFWLLGGTGYDSANTSPNVQNDVWKFDSAANEWTWVSGANADGGGDPGLFQVQGLLAAGNSPGARGEAMSWTDASGFWLYGGYGATLLPPGATSYSIVARGTNELWHFGSAIFYNGTGSMSGTFTDQNGCKYPAIATITNANVTMSTESAGVVTITYTVPALAPAVPTCPSYGANSGTFSVPVTVNGSAMQGLSGSIGSVSATINNGVVSGTVGFQETGPQGSGTFSWAESGSFSTVAVPVTDPNLAGLSEAAAAAAITNAGLWIGGITHQNSDTVPAGEVISQTPAANASATTGGSVSLVVSNGPASPSVPNVVGLTETAAQAAIAGDGLEVGLVTTQISATVPSGLVISQSPSAGTSVVHGASVGFIVSAGAGVIVPSVAGLSQTAATASITAVGLQIGTITMLKSATVPQGSVIGEVPAGGSIVAAGASIDMAVSSGAAGVGSVTLIPGNQNSAISSSTGIVGLMDALNPQEISCDARQVCTARTALTVQFVPTITIGQANIIIQSINGSVVGMTPGSPVVALDIPDPGSLAAYETLISIIRSNSLVAYVEEASRPTPASLPDGYVTASPHLDFLLAERAAAAWSVSQEIAPRNPNPPTIFIADYFVGGPPAPGAFSVNFQAGSSSYRAGLTESSSSVSSCASLSPTHGWSVLSAMAASFTGPSPIATGTVPIPISVIVWDYCRLKNFGYPNIVYELNDAATRGQVIVSSSLYPPCPEKSLDCSDNENVASPGAVSAFASDWLGALRNGHLSVRSAIETNNNFWIYAASGNNSGVPNSASALNNVFAFAQQEGVPGSTLEQNVTSVGSVDLNYNPPLAGQVSGFSSPFSAGATGIYAVAGFTNGGGVGAIWAFQDNGSTGAYVQGTSFAAPQVAGLAAFLSAMSDGTSLSLKQINDRIIETADSGVIDSYAALLSLDGGIVAPQSAPIRMAILASCNVPAPTATGVCASVAPDPDFDETALADIVSHLFQGAGTLDYSRYDLNGDGFTGGKTTASFDLDASYQGSGTKLYTTNVPGQMPIAGISMTFDETQLTDAQILCYYAYSPLYKQKNAAFDERPIILAPIASQCRLQLSQVNVTFNTIPSGWTNATPTTVQGFDTPPLTPGAFLIAGDPSCGINGEPVSGEQGTGLQGTGPQFSKQVPASAYLLASHWINATPFLTAYRPTVTPCSSFVAVQGRQMWLNATTAFFDFSTQLYNESQSRLYSGTPDASGNFVGGYVDFGYTLFGQFQDSLKILQAPMSTVQFLYVPGP
jgi:beta-lactam-binding protein with PASTA domain/N-acetylneuraminic acid mutarotase